MSTNTKAVWPIDVHASRVTLPATAGNADGTGAGNVIIVQSVTVFEDPAYFQLIALGTNPQGLIRFYVVNPGVASNSDAATTKLVRSIAVPSTLASTVNAPVQIDLKPYFRGFILRADEKLYVGTSVDMTGLWNVVWIGRTFSPIPA